MTPASNTAASGPMPGRSGDSQPSFRAYFLHQKVDVITAAITAISKEISQIATAAEQWTLEQRWLLLWVRIYRHHSGGKRPAGFLPSGDLLLSG